MKSSPGQLAVRGAGKWTKINASADNRILLMRTREVQECRCAILQVRERTVREESRGDGNFGNFLMTPARVLWRLC